jgi:hypothetical protein
MTENRIQLRLIADPLALTMEKLRFFRIGIEATNLGCETIDPELFRSQLLVNGRESEIWRLAIGNGRREEKWFALPPGETVSMTWSTMGVSLFPFPGIYTLVIRLDDNESQPQAVELLP